MKTLELIGTIKRIPISRERTGGRTRAEKPVSKLGALKYYTCVVYLLNVILVLLFYSRCERAQVWRMQFCFGKRPNWESIHRLTHYPSIVAWDF